MEIEEALVAHLFAQSGLTALISDRLYPNEVPQSAAYPAVTYQDISDIKVHTLTGQDSLEQPIKQFTAYASTKAQAKAVANQIKTALQDFQGTMSGIQVQYIQLQSEFANRYTTADGTVKVYTHDLEFQIYYVKE